MTLLDRMPKETGREYAMRILRLNIISLELPPGLLVSENQIAEELGLSRTPVREAMIELSKSQLVVILPQIGSRISLIDMELIQEAYFLRIILEKAIVELACEMATAQNIEALGENIKLQEFYVQNPSPIKLLELDDDFHFKIFSSCKKERIYSMMKEMSVHSDRLRQLIIRTYKSTNIVSEHRQIWEAIQSKDKQKAVNRIEYHLMRYRYDYDDISLKKEHPEFFK